MNSEQKIAVITYNTPHRKTQDVIFRLKAKGYKKVILLALPFVKRENPFAPIYQHRPSKAIAISPENLAHNFNYEFETITAETISEKLNNFQPNFTLIAGAGILPKDAIENHKIINSHPAYLPLVRGLDALKWAIHDQNTIGVTTHFISEEADAGWLINQKKITVFSNDTFHSVAYRQYELEIEMLIDAIELAIAQNDFPALSKEGNVNRRMPKSIEINLMAEFQQYLEVFAKI